MIGSEPVLPVGVLIKWQHVATHNCVQRNIDEMAVFCAQLATTDADKMLACLQIQMYL